jgi:hypothetical protein
VSNLQADIADLKSSLAMQPGVGSGPTGYGGLGVPLTGYGGVGAPPRLRGNALADLPFAQGGHMYVAEPEAGKTNKDK